MVSTGLQSAVNLWNGGALQPHLLHFLDEIAKQKYVDIIKIDIKGRKVWKIFGGSY